MSNSIKNFNIAVAAVFLLFACSLLVPIAAQAKSANRPAISTTAQAAGVSGDADVVDSPLCSAIASGDVETAKLLIQSPSGGVNTRATFEDGLGTQWERTPLILAARMGETEIVDLLLKKGADINARDRVDGSPLSQGYSALMYAASKNHLDTVQILLAGSRKPNVHLQNKFGKTALWFAVENENLEMVKVLFAGGSKINSPDNAGNSVLTATIEHAQYDILDFLVAKGADVNLANYAGVTPLMSAVDRASANTPAGLAYITKFLTFKPKLDFEQIKNNGCGYSALHAAARIGFINVIKLLLDNGANINIQSLATGGTPLHTAAGTKNTDVARYLISRGAKTEILDASGFTPITHAVIQVNLDMVKVLVESGAVIDTRSPNDIMRTPLIFAAANIDPFKHKDYIAIMNYLLDKKASIDFQAVNGSTALMAAAMSSNHSQALEKAVLLINRGAKIDMTNRSGETALMFASGAGNEKMVKLLIDKGAGIQLKNRSGETAMSYAKRSGKRDIVTLLESKGARADAPVAVKNVILPALIGTWQGYQDGMPQAIFTLVLYRDNTFDFVSKFTPDVLKQLPAGYNPVIAAQKGTYTFNGDILILNIQGKAPVSRQWKLEKNMLILDSIIKLKKIK